MNWTCATPLTSDAAAISLVVPEIVLLQTGAVSDTFGPAVSTFEVDTVTESEVVLPAASRATAVSA